LARRSKNKTLPGAWYYVKPRQEQEEYKKKNNPPGCYSCDHPKIISIDNLRTWMCGSCHLNPFKVEKQALRSSPEQKTNTPNTIKHTRKITF